MIKVVRKIHSIWAASMLPNPNIIGKYQYLYSNGKNEISLISLPNYFHKGETLWEIYCPELFEGVQRFPSRASAVKTIKKILK